MLYSHYTEKLIGLQGVIVKNIVQNQFNTTIFVEMPRKFHNCPCCNTPTNKIHDYREQKIKDIPAYGKFTNIVIRKRRYVCPKCSKRFYEDISFLPRYHRITNRLAAYVIDKLKCECSFTSIAKSVNLSISSVIRIFDIVSFPKPDKLPHVFAIDEFKGNAGKIKYQCIITDPDSKRVLDILPERSQQYLIKYLKQWNNTSRRRVKYFVSDMWSQYTDIASAFFKDATQVIDRYHFIRQIIWAFDNVRKRIQKTYGKQYRLLFKHSKRLLVKRATKLKDYEKERINSMLYISDELRFAYNLKELFYSVLDSTDRATAKELMSKWVLSAQNSGILEYLSCSSTLLNWQKGILNSFDVPYSNGFTEGCNNKIKVLKRNAYGYRNFERFRKRILHMFSC
jgi:transposase